MPISTVNAASAEGTDVSGVRPAIAQYSRCTDFDWPRAATDNADYLVILNRTGRTFLASSWEEGASLYSLHSGMFLMCMDNLSTEWTLLSSRLAAPAAPTEANAIMKEDRSMYKLSPSQLGARFFKDGRAIDSNPYLNDADNFNGFIRGWRTAESAHKARTQPHSA